MNRSVTPWILVLTGILFNIGSAIITHYFIGINNQHLSQLEQKVNQFEILIESSWRNKTEIDRKQEFLLILMTQNDDSDSTQAGSIKEYVQRQIGSTIKQYRLTTDNVQRDIPIDFDTINTISAQAKDKIIDSINESYLQKLDVENSQLPLKEKNALLLTIAIFLQVTGLILVLARDIRL